MDIIAGLVHGAASCHKRVTDGPALAHGWARRYDLVFGVNYGRRHLLRKLLRGGRRTDRALLHLPEVW